MSLHTPGWYMVQRPRGTLIDKFVPFTANYIGCKELGRPDHDTFLQLQREAESDGIVVRFRVAKVWKVVWLVVLYAVVLVANIHAIHLLVGRL